MRVLYFTLICQLFKELLTYGQDFSEPYFQTIKKNPSKEIKKCNSETFNKLSDQDASLAHFEQLL